MVIGVIELESLSELKEREEFHFFLVILDQESDRNKLILDQPEIIYSQKSRIRVRIKL
jgi:hypothetical protein